jgi:hypothetical protein
MAWQAVKALASRLAEACSLEEMIIEEIRELDSIVTSEP